MSLTFRTAFDLALATLAADSWMVANAAHVKVLPGVHAQMEITDLAKLFATTFADNIFTVIVEHPAASVSVDADRSGVLNTAIALVIVENTARNRANGETATIHPLDALQQIAQALYSQPANRATSPGANVFRPAPEFYAYRGAEAGNLYQRLVFTIKTELSARSPARPAPYQIQ